MTRHETATNREHISSIKDARVVEARELTSGAGRLRQGKVLLSGIEQLQWARDAKLQIAHIFVVGDADQSLPGWARATLPIFAVGEGVAKKITDTNYVVPIVAVAEVPGPANDTHGRLALVVDDVRDPGNIGTLVRTARGFGARDIWSTTPSFDPLSRKAIDASRGLVFSARFHRQPSAEAAAQALKRAGYEIVATAPHATTLQSRAQLSGSRLALIVGNESDGVSPALLAAADLVVQIPMRAVESLNVAVATGISLYELGYKMVLAMMTDTIRGIMGREFGSTHEAVHRLLDHKLLGLAPLGADEAVFLMRLACDRRSGIADVARDTQREGAVLDEFLARLAGEHWISVSGAGSERQVLITGGGEELLAQLWPIIESAHEIALAGISDEDQERLCTLLRAIQSNCWAAVQATGDRDGGGRVP